MRSKQLLIIFFLVFLEIWALHLFKVAIQTKNTSSLIWGIVIYGMIGFFLFQIMKIDKNIIVTNNVWQMLNVISITVVGLIYYKCKLRSLQTIGMVLAVASVISYSCDDLLSTND